ncbi:response regulator transcription factor [Pseudomonas ceruminis]|uniref:response regulator transcription factor n=1 Tax=Pseudomonas ceruminis TaxID=2740516 RepID=UPI001597052A|nr:helix-turn-helix transcriptional regulator [Pseudomonas ceruminis]
MHTETITANGLVGFLGRGAAPRELECLMAVASGLTSKEAAKSLGISAGSIDKRLLALTTKLGVQRRAALVAEAFKRQIISPAIIALCAILVGHSVTSTTEEFTRVRRPGDRSIASSRIYRRAECALAVA